jgi:3-oxoacyl-[acyl-carrier protein] reductase
MSAELAGKSFLVTGAASGIGRATAVALAEAGARLALLDRAAVSGFASDHLVLTADLTDETAIEAAVAAADAQFGGLDGLAHAAGIFAASPLTETSLAEFERIIAVNLTGTFLIVRAVVGRMRRGGRIVTLGSELASLGREGHAAYCASKAAVVAMTRCWAREFGPEILVNTVAPGPTDTPMLDWPGLSEAWRQVESSNPLGRIGRPEEIASVIRFLLGPGAGFMTGQTIGVNGGAVM